MVSNVFFPAREPGANDDERLAPGAARDLETELYEDKWGQSLHFAPRYRGESIDASVARVEHYLALRLGLGPGMRVIDLGCGLGGPMRSIARFSGASIVGINNNEYQNRRGRERAAADGLSHLCSFEEGDFHRLPFAPSSFDGALSIEALCYAPDRRVVFAEVLRVLKAGSLFAACDWCLTARYDATDPAHRRVKRQIEDGYALAELAPSSTIPEALKEVGFEVIEARDLVAPSDANVPWYSPLEGRLSLTGWPNTRLGGKALRQLVRVRELLGAAPKGSVASLEHIQLAGRATVEAGRLGIVTPEFFFLARKPAA